MTCVDVDIDGTTVRVLLNGNDEITSEEREIVAELVRTVKRQVEVCPACSNPKSCCAEHRTHRLPPNPHTNCILR
jgi:hypothetical protein